MPKRNNLAKKSRGLKRNDGGMPVQITPPRRLSLVRFNFESVPGKFHAKYPFVEGEPYIFFGELANMPGHCVVAHHRTGQLYSGYHTGNFIEIPEDDV